MSAINVVVQHKQVMIMVDGVSYDADGVIISIAQKCFSVPTANTVVASIGAQLASMIIAIELGARFQSFDAVVGGIEDQMPQIWEKHRASFERSTHADCEVYLAGWSEDRNRGECYTIKIGPPESADHWRKSAEGSGYSGEMFRLQQIRGITANPGPEVEQFRDAELTLEGTAETVHEHVTPLDLLHMLEIQRRMQHTNRGLSPLRHWVGGLALLTTISKDGVTQKVMHRWTEDQVGELITPRPMNWKRWREERAAVVAAASSAMSKLQRDMAARKQRKAERRAGGR